MAKKTLVNILIGVGVVCRHDRIVQGAGFALLSVFTRQSGVRAQPRLTSTGHTRCGRRHWTQVKAHLPAVPEPTQPATRVCV